MHELALMQDLVTTVEEQLDDGRVTRLWLEVGKLSCAAPGALRACFDACSVGTRLEGATLEIHEIPGLAECRGCGRRFAYEEPLMSCACGSFALDLRQGEELQLSQVEVV
ncbi:MAG: hydrogenase maturation nickel metallochaperone HypA [Polyangiales bacterium]